MTNANEPFRKNRWGPWGLWEIGLIVMLMFVYGGTQTPGINESHYLTRMKHFWNPTWCAGDLFLDSGESHPVFHTTFGGLSRCFSLPILAWVCRLLGWSMLAAAWYRLSRRMIPHAGWALLTAALAIVLWDRAHMAGEWVIGGLEAKVPAYALLFLALAEFARNHWRRALVIMGVATAFHPLVGGWSLLALGFAWLVDRGRPPLKQLAIPLLIAFAISMLGVIPALRLDGAVDLETVSQARRAYVLQRLGHHLLFWRLPSLYHLRHLVLIVVWLWLWKSIPTDSSQNRVQRFVLGCVMIGLIGIVIESTTQANWIYCSAWMRYYWYRMTDSMVPVGFVLLVGRSLCHKWSLQPKRGAWAVAVVSMVVAASLSLTLFARRSDRRPPADRQGRMFDVSTEAWAREYLDWRALCDWCRENSTQDAVFLTPTYTQTFKWYAHRPEFVTWKDIPQDSRSIVEWSRRRREVRHLGVYFSRGKPTHEHFSRWVAKYRIDYVVTSRLYGDPVWRLPLLFENGSYRVYQITSQSRVATEVLNSP